MNVLATLASSVFLLTVVAAAAAAAQANINYDIFLQDKAYVRNQLDCVLKIRVQICDKIGKRISALLPEAANNGKCNGCNDAEKVYMVKTSQHIKRNYPTEWSQLMELYKVDPKLRDTFFQSTIPH